MPESCKTPSTRKPRVLVAISMQSGFGPAVTNGVFRFLGNGGGWSVEFVRSPQEFTAPMLAEALAHRTEGIILGMPNADDEVMGMLVDAPVPLVTVDIYSPLLERRKAALANVRMDNYAIGRDAARAFLRQGVYNGFGFVPVDSDLNWSRRREDAFRDAIDEADFYCDTFRGGKGRGIENRGYIAKWLRHLPKPAAVMAAHDILAFEVLQAATAAKLRIPQDVAIIGVDDERLICENATPRLSSVKPDFEQAGYLAGERLAEMMRAPDAPHWRKPRVVTVGGETSALVLRESTVRESEAGRLVQKAVAFIENNVGRGIGVKDVVAHLGISRSLADLRFRQIRHTSILATILSRRLDELKKRLSRTDEPIESITRSLGWTSPNYPKNLFRKRFGMSMREWRRGCLPTAGEPRKQGAGRPDRSGEGKSG